MTTVKNIYDYIDKIAPYSSQMNFDNSGFMVGNFSENIKKCVVCLDITVKVIDFALKNNANLIISHHPVIFKKIDRITNDDMAYLLIKNGISSISAHTNFDMTDNGIDDMLSQKLRLISVKRLPCGVGRIGTLESPMNPEEFAKYVQLKIKNKTNNKAIRYISGEKKIKTVATICGSGGSYIENAYQQKADAIVTGDLKHEHFIFGLNNRITLIDAGHYDTEYFGVIALKQSLEQIFTDLDFIIDGNEAFMQEI